jgi:hypothetical protein
MFFQFGITALLKGSEKYLEGSESPKSSDNQCSFVWRFVSYETELQQLSAGYPFHDFVSSVLHCLLPEVWIRIMDTSAIG